WAAPCALSFYQNRLKIEQVHPPRLWQKVTLGIVRKTMTSLFKPLTIGISTSALFDLRAEHDVYVNDGIDAYRRFQFERRHDPMKPGTAFSVIQKLLAINTPGVKPRVEVALISRNNIETGIRARYSLDHHKLDIARIALTGGKPVES